MADTQSIQNAVPALLEMARQLTWNNISDNCKFILSEIKNAEGNFLEQRKLITTENDKKLPVDFSQLEPILQHIYANLYDINLYVYKATKTLTVIDIRYYPKSSLDEDYRKIVADKEPMLHCKVATPPWISEKKEKFNINWEHHTGWYKWRLFWMRLKFKIKQKHKR